MGKNFSYSIMFKKSNKSQFASIEKQDTFLCFSFLAYMCAHLFKKKTANRQAGFIVI